MTGSGPRIASSDAYRFSARDDEGFVIATPRFGCSFVIANDQTFRVGVKRSSSARGARLMAEDRFAGRFSIAGSR